MGFLKSWLWAFYDVARDPSTHQLAASVAALLAIGTTFYHFVEGWGWIDSLYFSVITVTTVGYGDFAPTTDAAKLFTVLYVLAGISVIIAFANTILRRAALHTNRGEREGMDNTDRMGGDTDPLDGS